MVIIRMNRYMLERGVIGALIWLDSRTYARPFHLIHRIVMETTDIIQTLRNA